MGGAYAVEWLCECLRDGDSDTDQSVLVCTDAHEHGAWTAVARAHGDLWYGNAL